MVFAWYNVVCICIFKLIYIFSLLFFQRCVSKNKLCVVLASRNPVAYILAKTIEFWLFYVQ